jgi:hypothetical protein
LSPEAETASVIKESAIPQAILFIVLYVAGAISMASAVFASSICARGISKASSLYTSSPKDLNIRRNKL